MRPICSRRRASVGIGALEAMVEHFDPAGALDSGNLLSWRLRDDQGRDVSRDSRDGPPFDALVIGGGITGAGSRSNAPAQGSRTALVEARDYASGTSSRTSRLVHGGLRYLAQGDFRLTRELVADRTELLRAAPGLVQPLGFLLPVRKGDKFGRFALGLGARRLRLFRRRAHAEVARRGVAAAMRAGPLVRWA